MLTNQVEWQPLRSRLQIETPAGWFGKTWSDFRHSNEHVWKPSGWLDSEEPLSYQLLSQGFSLDKLRLILQNLVLRKQQAELLLWLQFHSAHFLFPMAFPCLQKDCQLVSPVPASEHWSAMACDLYMRICPPTCKLFWRAIDVGSWQ